MLQEIKKLYKPFNNFLVRTPLLPLQVLESFTEENLKQHFRNPVIGEAIFLASPVLHSECIKWINNEIKEKKEETRIIYSLMRYLLRMSTRCTPFGLFAGCTVGEWVEANEGQIANKEILQNPQSKYKSHTRLDMHYLCALSQNLTNNSIIREKLKFFPNSSIYKYGKQLRYVEYHYIDKKRVHHLVAIDDSEYIQAVLKATEKGSKINILADLLIDNEIDFEEAKELGSVLVTVTDRKIAHSSNGNTIDYYTADITSSQDYYPGGMLQPGRNFNSNSYKFGMNGQLKDDEISGVVGANYSAEFWEYDSRIVKRWNTDPVVKEWESPYACFAGNPIGRVDPTGALDWIPPTDGSGNWTAEAGDSPGSLAVDAGLSQSEAVDAVRSANQDRDQVRTSETMVYPGDVVNVQSRPGYVWSSGSSSTTPITPSTASNTTGSTSNPVQTVKTVNDVAGIVIPVAEQTVQSTQIGANFAYAISGNTKIINGVTNGFKYVPYVGLGVTVLAGTYLSSQIDPATNQPYQSWTETGVDIGANAGTIAIGTEYGGWWGAAAATLYVLDKEAFKSYVDAHIKHPEYFQGIPFHR